MVGSDVCSSKLVGYQPKYTDSLKDRSLLQLQLQIPFPCPWLVQFMSCQHKFTIHIKIQGRLLAELKVFLATMWIASITPLCSWGKILCDMEFRIRPTSSGFVVAVVVVVVVLNWKAINGTASIQLKKCTNILLYSMVVLGKEKAMFSVKNMLFTGCWVIPHFKSTWWVLQWNNDVIMCSCQYQVVLCWYLLIPIPIPILTPYDTLQEQVIFIQLHLWMKPGARPAS